nr:immunoglobulin light chain junction region [Macaca mulatta]MOV60939.1 immunoglobulin light chain junction region [Macaca mulatta]MOV60986.1 immunoglobulin light chain junction region [Macaca mulatta]MOV61012.1 immunoglobulin light chain junction region [Macaca mulatta]MOV61019.1 immunoglobulin light chain junction region [Macaca mulatta]
CLQYISSPYTF